MPAKKSHKKRNATIVGGIAAAILAFLLWPRPAKAAAKISFTIKLVAAATSAPIAAGTITYAGISRITDANGLASWTGVPDGPQPLSASATGYVSYSNPAYPAHDGGSYTLALTASGGGGGGQVTGSGTVSNFIAINPSSYTIRACLSADINPNAVYVLVPTLTVPGGTQLQVSRPLLTGTIPPVVPPGSCAFVEGSWPWGASLPTGTYTASFYVAGALPPYTSYVRISDVYTVTFTIQSYTLQPLAVTLSASSTSVPLGYPITFNAYASGGVLPYQYTWDFGDGKVIVVPPNFVGKIQNHLYSNPGTYQVRVTVEDAFKKTATAAVTVTVT